MQNFKNPFFFSFLLRSRQRFVEIDSQHGGRQCHTREGRPFRTSDGLESEKIKCRVDIDTPVCPEKAEESYWSSWCEWGDCNVVEYLILLNVINFITSFFLSDLFNNTQKVLAKINNLKCLMF